ncbi:hypothetical protein ABK040_007970 [Willaertia magna]
MNRNNNTGITTLRTTTSTTTNRSGSTNGKAVRSNGNTSSPLTSTTTKRNTSKTPPPSTTFRMNNTKTNNTTTTTTTTNINTPNKITSTLRPKTLSKVPSKTSSNASSSSNNNNEITNNNTTNTNSSSSPSRPKKISVQRFDKHKVSDPFSSSKKKFKTTFGLVYEAGGIPCRIQHTAANMHLQWDNPIENIPYDPLLTTIADGLRETDHPYVVIVKKAFEQLCSAEEAREKIIPMLRNIVPYLRLALQSNESAVFVNALEAVKHISYAVCEALDDHLPMLLIQISKKCFDKRFSGKIVDVLQTIERNSNNTEIGKLIKSKVPTYKSILL